MWRGILASAAVIFLVPAASHAQRGNDDGAVDSTMYFEAFKMVSNGNPEDGRELVDSLLRASKEGSPQYIEGLYWRARLASIGPKAEKDYRRIIVDYPLSHRAPEALIRLGQLELARGDRDPAAQHFQRAIRNYPNSSSYATANYWLARTYFEGNKIERACIANAEAMTSVDPADVELKNRIEFQNRQCHGVALKVPTAGDSAPAASEAAVANGNGDGHEDVRDGEPIAADSAQDVANNTAEAGEHPSTDVAEEGSGEAGDAQAQDAQPSASKSGKSIPVLGTSAHESSAASSKTKRPYMVQVAAFNSRAQANKLAAGLKEKGYSVHVDGTKAPYRVRIGHFATRAAADAMLAKLRAKHIDGFITQG
jgi:cell division protein FtsN